MPLTVLNVAFPFAPVGPAAVGGAEQVVAQLDRLLVAAGHRSMVLACAGSSVAGELIEIPCVEGMIDFAARNEAWRAIRARIAELVSGAPIDVIHMHGLDFHHYAPLNGPTLVSLHLPLAWYEADAWANSNPRLRYHCVSRRQQGSLADPRFLPPIANGVPVPERPARARGGFALVLCRICPEKGVHLAIEATRLADVPLVIAGRAFPYPEHEAYFADRVKPHLGERVRFVGPVGLDEKARLLARARCVLVPSLAEETSSLVAMEALAHGAPVIAFDRGALASIVEHGRTGYVVSDEREMAAAISQTGVISSQVCWQSARERFSEARLFALYLEAYRAVADGP